MGNNEAEEFSSMDTKRNGVTQRYAGGVLGKNQAEWKPPTELWGTRLVDSARAAVPAKNASLGVMLLSRITNSCLSQEVATQEPASFSSNTAQASSAEETWLFCVPDSLSICFCLKMALLALACLELQMGQVGDFYFFFCSSALVKAIEFNQSHFNFVNRLLISEFCF